MEGISIRGAASTRNSTVGRLRRNVPGMTSAMAAAGSTRAAANVGAKVMDVWRDFVARRWNPETRFLNLEVSLSAGLLLMNAVVLMKMTVAYFSPCWMIQNYQSIGCFRLGRRGRASEKHPSCSS